MTKSSEHNQLIAELFRTEYTKLTAVLCRQFGIQYIEIAEDIVSDTFLKATELWETKLPENPTAWLYTVAKNKTKDYFKHTTITNTYSQIQSNNVNLDASELFANDEFIQDSQLMMMFKICLLNISDKSQICLILQILCGFTIEEIAKALLENKESTKKRLHRAKTTLRESNQNILIDNAIELNTNLNIVLKAIYLLFNQGYYAETNDKIIRKELCVEATRLAYFLTENKKTSTPKANALLALFCYQSSRIEARISADKELILFEEQDQSLWDNELLNKGHYYLIQASNTDTLSTYHLEASIAYWHTTNAPNKWGQILNLYNTLVIDYYSTSIALNRTFAYAKVYGADKAIIEALKLNLTADYTYYALLSYLYAENKEYKVALTYINSAIEKCTNIYEIKLLQKRKEKL